MICANSNRAVNDQTAKKLLGQEVRRQLMMDGHFNHLCFVATQTDVLNPDETIENLNLAEDTSREGCALQRNSYIKERLLNDFYEGIREIQESAGEETNQRDLERRFHLPVFTASAIDYQKHTGLRSDGDHAFSDIQHTEIPKIQEHLINRTIKERYNKFDNMINSVISLYRTICAIVSASKMGNPSELIQKSFTKAFDIEMVESSHFQVASK